MGKLKEYALTDFGLIGKTESELIEVQVYSDSIIRVRITRNSDFDPFDYALDMQPKPKAFNKAETDDYITISTSLVTLEISKEPVRFTFKNADGRVINEDDTAFGVSWQGEQVTAYKKLQENEKFVGLGEKTGPLNKRGMGFQNWNTDHFGYDVNTDPIYCSVPFYIGLHDEVAYGIYFNNSYKTQFNFGASNNRFASFGADTGDMDYFFIHDSSVAGIVSSYSELTGKMPMPPVWSLGYQQCRYSYYPDKEVLNTAQNFRDKEIPADVIVLDIHYMDKYKIFTWDGERFPDPESMILKLKSLGFEVVVMCDPGIKVEEGYETYDSGVREDVFLKYPDGQPYEGQVWPGWCHFPDFTQEKTRVWWQEQLKHYSDLGINGYWNDMNEIATWGQSLPELIEFDFDGNKGTTRNGRNVFGMMMSKSTYEGAKENLNGQRPFNLTRAGFAGIQKYAAVWTGDNVASDEHMLLGMRMLNGMGLSGIPFAGFDTGGFIGNASEELFARWISMAAFTPFFRGHSNVNTRDSEPWAYGEHTEEISRNYIKLRYKLMPYIYSTFYTAATTGLPINRSLVLDYSNDEKIFDTAYENEFLFGDSILVAPVSSKKEFEKIYFPKGTWYDLFTDVQHQGPQESIVECPVEKLPVFVKASAIIPFQSQTQTTSEKPSDTLDLHIYKGSEHNSFVYYEDDGRTFEHQNGAFYKRKITLNSTCNSLLFTKVEGDFKSNFNKVKVYFHGFGKSDLKNIETEANEFRFIQPLSNFDPIDFNVKANYSIKNLATHTVNFDNEEFSINW
ncbi:MAG: DUF4968 domain-containing protein [Reichenbachiella sp.]